MECSAPGSVLLLGEYAVLAPGRMGIAAAVEQRVRVRCSTGDELRIEGSNGVDRFLWSSGSGELLDAVVEACSETLRRPPNPVLIQVDSSSLNSDGRKIGLGSSAAVAVAVSYALLARGEATPSLDMVFRTALSAHRAVQGGRGSGYDVAASTFGGVGLFRGGPKPRYEMLSAGPNKLLLILGERSLDTTLAIGCYAAWARRRPDDGCSHQSKSDEIVRRAVQNGRWADALRSGRQLTQRLGEDIGVDVEPPELRERLDYVAEAGHVGKPTGAGGELAVCVPTPGVAVAEEPWLWPVTVSPNGVCVR